jgi:hypothetical protein
MAFHRGPKIVTDGLVLALDAGNTKSYPGSGNSWFDLSSSKFDAELINSPVFENDAIVFSGTNEYAIVTNSTPDSLKGNPTFTVEGWFKRSGSWSGGATWGIGGDSVLQGINSYNMVSNRVSIDLWGNTTISAPEEYSLDEWKHCVWVYNGTIFTTDNITIYVNSISYTGNQLTVHRGNSGSTPNINSNGIVLSRAGVTTNSYYGKPIISNFRIYNRVLTQDEIVSNFNSQKSRFEL